MKFNLENVTEKDIDIVINNNFTLEEIECTTNLLKKINSKFICNDVIFIETCIASYFYKLGEIQGKRTERTKRKNRGDINA